MEQTVREKTEQVLTPVKVELVWFVILILVIMCVLVLGSRGRYDFGNNFTGLLSTTGKGTGVLDDYGFTVADVDGYGMARVGCLAFGITNYNAGSMDLDGTAVFRNLEGPKTGIIEFVFEAGSGKSRLIIPTEGVGNAAHWTRSVIIIGPDPQNDGSPTIGYWQTQEGAFLKLVADTVGSGAEFGVQGNVQFMKYLYVNDIEESTDGSGITLHNDTSISGTLTVSGDQSGATDHVFDDYDDVELLRKWRRGEELPFAKGDILNQNRLLRDSIIQLKRELDDLRSKL